MGSLIDGLFLTSVQQAVQLTLSDNKPLFVYISSLENTELNDKFVNKFINQELVNTLKTNFILLKLIENSTEFEYFKQIFKSLIVPSFYIVMQGKLEAVITDDTTLENFKITLNKFNKVEETTTVSQSEPANQSLSNDNSQSTNLSDHDISVLKHKQLVAQQKQNQIKEKQRLRELLKADQRERKSKLKEEKDKYIKESSTTHNNIKKSNNSQNCVLAIKLFDGSTIKKEFKSTNTLIDVRKYLDEEVEIIPSTSNMPSFASTTYLYPTGYSFHRPTLPRVTYTEDQESNSLSNLDLTPRSILILKPIYSESQTNNQKPDNERGIFKNIYKGVGNLGSAIMSFFDYGIDDPRNNNPLSGSNQDLHLTPSSTQHSHQQQHQHQTHHHNVPEIPPPVIPGFLGIGDRALSSSLLSIHEERDRDNAYMSDSIHSDVIHEVPFESRASSPRFNGNSVNLNERDEDK
ncbi:uncharacterized protein KGF55_004609 [Candida pseudojiufengensis]|uniref:uncharacterized protein n=1 Tax=Candida pseudojiufengensis TaxID=497109 RepID=UPI0022249891|nr:uncharacterized protein KGF55_004609 [Candida pseudojiufengensis]KAI5960317.1 hypothetical protein KGF55_004609 [Candida pseudojiufengensis]